MKDIKLPEGYSINKVIGISEGWCFKRPNGDSDPGVYREEIDAVLAALDDREYGVDPALRFILSLGGK